jgi:hypothetical protein
MCNQTNPSRKENYSYNCSTFCDFSKIVFSLLSVRKITNYEATASPQVEVFLDEVAEQLLTELDKSKGQPETNKMKEIRHLEAKLKEHLNRVVIPANQEQNEFIQSR